MENEILEIMEAGMKRRLIFSDMLELQKIARAVNLATKAHYEAKMPSDEKIGEYAKEQCKESKNYGEDMRLIINALKWLKSQLTKQT